jgi:hypothetical protein
VADRISELQALQKQLQKLRGRCRKVRTVKDCGILKSLGNGQEAPGQTGSEAGDGCAAVPASIPVRDIAEMEKRRRGRNWLKSAAVKRNRNRMEG